MEVTFPEQGNVRGFKFVLYNDSEHPISGFYLGRYKERRLIPTLLNGHTFQKLRNGEVEQTGIGTVLLNPKSELVGFDGRRGDFVLTIEGASTARHLRSGRSNMPTVLPAAESVALKPGPNHRFRWSTVYWIGFLDANGNRWEREVTNSITTYGRLRKGKRGYFEIRAKRRRRRLKHYWDVTLDRSGLGHSLRPLEREGLIRLEISSRDRRSTLVALTDQGRERYAHAHTLWQKAQDRYASVVGEAQANQLRQHLLEIGHDDQLA